jgi:hypothetical protein
MGRHPTIVVITTTFGTDLTPTVRRNVWFSSAESDNPRGDEAVDEPRSDAGARARVARRRTPGPSQPIVDARTL